MSRKSFIIWGLAIIQLYVTIMTIMAYLAISKTIDLKEIVPYLRLIPLITLVGFGCLLFLRFKAISRRKRILAACLPFCVLSFITAGFLVMPLMDIIDFSGHGIMPIANAAVDGQNITVWMKMRFALLLAPAHYLSFWGLFALLAFGSLDPRKPSKNRVIQFFKTGFQRKPAAAMQTGSPKIANA